MGTPDSVHYQMSTAYDQAIAATTEPAAATTLAIEENRVSAGKLGWKTAAIPIEWNAGLPIFASEQFLRYSAREYGWLGGIDPLGSLRCILPYTIMRKGLVRLARFRVETLPLDGELSLIEEREFLDSAITYLRSHKADVVIPAPASTIFKAFPSGADAAPYGTYVVDLTKGEEELWKRVHPKHRNKIRGAQKNKVEIKTGLEYKTAAYEMVRETLARSQMSFLTPKAFARFCEALGERLEIFVAKSGDALQGCAIFPFSTYGAHYLYGGSAEKSVSGAMNLLHWEAMLHFRRIGTRRYDFVGARINPEKGSKQEGLANFKMRFGGALNQGYMWKYTLRPLRSKVYSLAVNYLKGGDVVDQEGHKMSPSEV